MRKVLKIVLPILLVLAILGSVAWYLLEYDPGFTLDVLLNQARYWEARGQHSTAVWFYDLAYRQSDNDEAVAMELAQRFKKIGNYTKAEYTLSNAIRDGGSAELYIALCRTFVEQDKLLDAVMMLENVANPQIKAQLDEMRPAAPTSDVEPGFYSQYLDVTIAATGGELYLTTNGEYPSVASGPSTGVVTLPGGETTIYAVTVAENGLVSPVSIFGYTVGGVIEKIEFADPVVEQAIRQELNVGADTVLYTDDLWELRELTVPNEAQTLSDLSGLTYLTKLTVKGAPLENGAFLAGLTNLETLTVSGSPVSGEVLTAIAALPALRELTIAGGGLSNIQALAQAKQLRYLDLNGNAVRELEPLSGMTGLETLNLQRNAVTDLTPLASLTELTGLDVSYNALTSLGPVSSCIKLNRLDAAQNKIKTISGLGKLSALMELSLAGNSLTEISALSGCTALETLNLSGNRLTELDALASLKKLRVLDFSHNQVAALPDFSTDCGLGEINGAYNMLTDLDGLSGLENLGKVTMDYNSELASVDTLMYCPVLVQVNVFGTAVSDVTALTAKDVVVNYDPTQ